MTRPQALILVTAFLVLTAIGALFLIYGNRQDRGTLIEATLKLEPIYKLKGSKWGTVPHFMGARATAMVNNTNLTVEAYSRWYQVWEGWVITVYVNGSAAYTGGPVDLPGLVVFRHAGALYRVEVSPPEPPRLNRTVLLETSPMGVVQLVFSDDKSVNVTMYSITNRVLRLREDVVLVIHESSAGDARISRTGFRLGFHVFGVPSANYTVKAQIHFPNGTSMDIECHAGFYYGLWADVWWFVYQRRLLPIGSIIQVKVEELNLTLTGIVS